MTGGISINILDMSTNGLSSDEIIEVRKMLAQQIKNARSNSRHKKCMLCDQVGGFCNSHTIPQFCLENIAWNGKLNSFDTLIDSALLNKDSGINNAGIFHIICRPCDSKVFQDYEKAGAYEGVPSEAAINQIVLKTVLRDIYKHETEIEMFEASKKVMKEKSPFLSFFVNMMLEAQINARSTDIQECYDIFNRAKDFLNTHESWLRIVSYDKLNFTVPIAFQGMVALITGVHGEVINNIFEHNGEYKMEYLHIAVFPLKQSTAIILFIDANCTRYSQFEKYITETSLENRLEIIGRIIFLYTEDYYLSKQLDENIIKYLQEPAKIIHDMATFNPRRSIKKAVNEFDLRRHNNIPNIFTKEHAISFEQEV